MIGAIGLKITEMLPSVMWKRRTTIRPRNAAVPSWIMKNSDGLSLRSAR